MRRWTPSSIFSYWDRLDLRHETRTPTTPHKELIALERRERILWLLGLILVIAILHTAIEEALTRRPPDPWNRGAPGESRA